MNEEEFYDDVETSDYSEYLEDDESLSTGEHDDDAGTLVSHVKSKYQEAETARSWDEVRWLRAYRNYRGLYGSDVQFSETEKSRVFVKVTKTKVLASYSQIGEVLFGANKFPITINPTRLPEGVEEAVSFDTNPKAVKIPEEDQALKPGETMGQYKMRLGALEEKLKPVQGKLVKGHGQTPTSVTFHPAMVAAKNMEKKVHDALEECNANKELRTVAFESTLFGTGIMKGPFIETKEYPKWNEDGNYEPLIKPVPRVSAVSIWDFYPDPSANCLEDCDYVIERHKMTEFQVSELSKKETFRPTAIKIAIERGPSYYKHDWEHALEDYDYEVNNNRFEVLEFWGTVSKKLLEDLDVNLELSDDREYYAINAWVCNGQLLRCVINPFTPTYLPYYAVPYEVNPYSFFGIGVAENMDDTQTLMNGFMRMAVDNAALSGNLIFEVDEDSLAPGEDFTIYPGKIFKRQSGAPGQAMFATQFPNVSQQNMQMFDKARQLSDESTGMPSFAHGQTGVTGVGRTASGISMLMSAANSSVRTVVKNLDDYLLAPLGRNMFRYFMQFDFDKDISGDLEVKAQGTESLMANEVRSQRLMQFLSTTQSPQLAPFANNDYILREIAKSLDLDPDKVVNSLSDAAIQAEIQRKLNPQPEVDPNAPQVSGEGQLPQPSDTAGGGAGNIGTGNVPTPEEDGFSGQ